MDYSNQDTNIVKKKNKSIKLDAKKIILFLCIGVSCFVFLSLLLGGTGGNVFGKVAYFFRASLGLFSYPLFLGILTFCIMKLQNKKITLSRQKIALLASAILCGVLLIHIFTTFKYIPESVSDYFSYVKSMQYSMGGVVFGAPAYGLCKLTRPVAIILLSIGFLITLGLFSNFSGKKIKLKYGKKSKDKPKNLDSNFVKGKSPFVTPVLPQVDNSLFVEQIIPKNKPYEFSQNFAPVEQNINSSIVTEAEKVLPLQLAKIPTNTGLMTKIVDIDNNVINGTIAIDSNLEPVTVTQEKSQAYKTLYESSVSPIVYSGQDATYYSRNYNGSKKSNKSPEKPPMIRHTSLEDTDLPPTIQFPQLPDVEGVFVRGDIINGDNITNEFSTKKKQIVDNDDYDFANLTTEKIQARLGGSKTKGKKNIVVPNIPLNSDALQKATDSKIEKQEQELYKNRAPIINGDVFSNVPKKKEVQKPILDLVVEEKVVQAPIITGSSYNTPSISSEYTKVYSKRNIEKDFANLNENEKLIRERENLYQTMQDTNSYHVDEEASTIDFDIEINDNYEVVCEKKENIDTLDVSDDILDFTKDDTLVDIVDEKIDDNQLNKNTKDIVTNNFIESEFDKVFEDIDDIASYGDINIDGKIIIEDSKPSTKNKQLEKVKAVNISNEESSYLDLSKYNKENGLRPLVKKSDESVKEVSIKKKKKQKYVYPPINLLGNISTDPSEYSDNCQENSEKLLATLESFNFPAKVIGITQGPAVTRYELDVPVGVGVKKIEQFSHDIAYNLASSGSIRIEAPIPGKRAVGIEVPNNKIGIVGLRDIIDSKEFKTAQSHLTLALGKDISGKNIVCNLEKMPHLLIAGATNSGKSACLNAIITSLIYKSSPDDVRLVLIDPKRVEFTIYANLPHLMIKNIITEPEQAINALDWAILEMENRYKLLATRAFRNLAEYNNSEAVKNGLEEKLPSVVIIIDELADLMINAKRDVEIKIRTITAKARAAGIHLILATQRPSVDVITGTIKANLPSRIAFAVTSITDSRTILDSSGAESLLGRGDMLYCPIDNNNQTRVQGAYITGDEVSTIVSFCKENNQGDFDDDIFNLIMKSKNDDRVDSKFDDSSDSSFDPLLGDATRQAITNGTASVSMIQRRLGVGYNRAGRLIDEMEKRGYIGPADGAKARSVFLTKSQYVDEFGEDFEK